MKKNRGRKDKSQPKPQYDEGKFKALDSKFAAQKTTDTIRLNRFIANAGVCSRREADELIVNGMISVNGEVVSELGYQVKRTDKVAYKGKELQREKMVYILLNKPKDYITTVEDPDGRNTVMDLIKEACEERVYPVGRLDRNTTGLLLFTNDGDLARALAHPSGNVQKIYLVELDKPLTEADFNNITQNGVVLEDGAVPIDGLSIISDDRKSLGIELHSGKNRVVRRVFEKFGYDVTKLDRTVFAGLTKKNIPRGQWRFLSQKEVVHLKYFTAKKPKTDDGIEG